MPFWKPRTIAPARPTVSSVPPVIAAVDDEALEDVVGEAADRQRRADDEDVDRLVEVPLVVEEGVDRAEALLQAARRLRAGDVEEVGDADPGDARSRRRSARPIQLAVVDGLDRRQRRVGEDRVEEVGDGLVDARHLDEAGEEREEGEDRPSPPSSAATARRCGGRRRGSRRRCPRFHRSPGWWAPRRGRRGRCRSGAGPRRRGRRAGPGRSAGRCRSRSAARRSSRGSVKIRYIPPRAEA